VTERVTERATEFDDNRALAQRQSRLNHYLSRWWNDLDGAPESLRAQRDTAMDGLVTLLSELAASLNQRQRLHLLDRLMALHEDLVALQSKR
ncbi:MAG: hypothetical protein KDK91_32315, partial [Gammaproteobacteria bacterium]|nr:hypothetical protein [Gammaproteobacteria bacterium]